MPNELGLLYVHTLKLFKEKMFFLTNKYLSYFEKRRFFVIILTCASSLLLICALPKTLTLTCSKIVLEVEVKTIIFLEIVYWSVTSCIKAENWTLSKSNINELCRNCVINTIEKPNIITQVRNKLFEQ